MLIVGATGVLLPAVHTYLGRGATVVAVARNRARLTGLALAGGERLLPVSLDVFEPAAVDGALASAPLRDGVDAAVLYVAGTDDDAENEAVARLSQVVRGATLRILTSRWQPPPTAEPSSGRWPRVADRWHLLLGHSSVPGADGGFWHTPQQISAAAVAALAGGRDAVLGRSSPLGPHALPAAKDPEVGGIPATDAAERGPVRR